MSFTLPRFAALVAVLHLIVILYAGVYRPDIVRQRAVEEMCRDAIRLGSSGKIDEAGKLLERATNDYYAVAPAAAKAHLLRAKHLLRYSGSVEEARTHLRVVATAYPEFVEADDAEAYLRFMEKAGGESVLQLYFGASGKRLRKRSVDALADLDTLVDQWPSNSVTPYALYQSYEIATHELKDSSRSKTYARKLFLLVSNDEMSRLSEIF